MTLDIKRLLLEAAIDRDRGWSKGGVSLWECWSENPEISRHTFSFEINGASWSIFFLGSLTDGFNGL
jgi:hypothetical protein